MKSRRDEIFEAAASFHAEHPAVWALFVKYTMDRINRGFKHYGAAQIMGRIRWETDLADVDGNTTFKINSNFIPHYARRFMRLFPEHAGFFRTRVLKSAAQPALYMPELGPQDHPYNNQGVNQ